MPPDVFNLLLEIVRPYITKKHTNMRSPISAEERLSITLRYLALGKILYIYIYLLSTLARLSTKTGVLFSKQNTLTSSSFYMVIKDYLIIKEIDLPKYREIQLVN